MIIHLPSAVNFNKEYVGGFGEKDKKTVPSKGRE